MICQTTFGTLPDALFKAVEDTQRLPGWCQWEKALDLAGLVLRERPTTCVELGVYGGRSLLPVALALQHNQHGCVYAVDPWDNVAPTEGIQPSDERWWATADLAPIHAGFMAAVTERNLWPHVRVLHTDSRRAAPAFLDRPIDMLHVDGNHSEEVSSRDVSLYLPMVRSGGWVWLDDTDWASIQRAVQLTAAQCEERGRWSRWMLFEKR